MTTITALEEWLRHDTDIYTSRPTVEEGHTKACLANAIICAVENWRDDSNVGDVDFRLAAQSNTFMHHADEYLASGLSDCQCPPKERRHAYTFTLNFSDGGFQTMFGTLDDAIREAVELSAPVYRGAFGTPVSITMSPYGDAPEVVWMPVPSAA